MSSSGTLDYIETKDKQRQEDGNKGATTEEKSKTRMSSRGLGDGGNDQETIAIGTSSVVVDNSNNSGVGRNGQISSAATIPAEMLSRLIDGSPQSRREAIDAIDAAQRPIPHVVLPNISQNGSPGVRGAGDGGDSIGSSSVPPLGTPRETAQQAPDSSPPVVVADQDDDSKRYCWVCFATDEDDETALWVKPCRCRGTTKWVHQACIQRWIDEKQKGNTAAKVSCPQCNTEYFIVYPPQGSVVIIMDSVDALISRVCPFVAAGIVVGSIYWTAVTYGAITCMQILGHKEGLRLMERTDPLFLLFGLPCIPVMLIVGKMIRWEDSVLRFIRKHSYKIPIFRHILPTINPPTTVERLSQDLPPLSDPVSATRILCGALLLPTIASVLGKVLFENVRSNFRRALLGGVAFVTIKGVLRIYHKQQQHVRQAQRKIMDYSEERTRATEALARHAQNGSPSNSPRPRNI